MTDQKSDDKLKAVWVFNGAGARFPSAVFSSLDAANEWIRLNHVSGVLTEYPLDMGAYEWAVSSQYFEPKGVAQTLPEFIQKFTSASQQHYHYDQGRAEGALGDERGV